MADMVWWGLPLRGRAFGTVFDAAAEGNAYGRIYGSRHEEVGGLFHRDGIAGAFAARRDRWEGLHRP